MSTTEIDEPVETMATFVERLGGVGIDRVVMKPLPGTATEKDLLALMHRTKKLYELVDGVLVEKILGFRESLVNLYLAHLLQSYLDKHDLGILGGADGPLRLLPQLVRLPDTCFIRWEQLPGRVVPSEKIPTLYPDLAVEVLSEGNTAEEIDRKLKEYFLAGTTLVWIVDPDRRTVAVHTAPDVSNVLTDAETLDGGATLPGLSLPVKRIFERLPPPEAKPRRGTRKK